MYPPTLLECCLAAGGTRDGIYAFLSKLPMFEKIAVHHFFSLPPNSPERRAFGTLLADVHSIRCRAGELATVADWEAWIEAL